MRFSGRLRGGDDGGDRNGVLAFEIEEHAVVATAKTEAGERRLEFLHVAGAVGQGSDPRSRESAGRFRGRWRADRQEPPATRPRRSVQALAVRSFTQAELAQDVFVRVAFSASERSAGTVERGSRLRRELFFFHWSGSQRTRQWFPEFDLGIAAVRALHLFSRMTRNDSMASRLSFSRSPVGNE